MLDDHWIGSISKDQYKLLWSVKGMGKGKSGWEMFLQSYRDYMKHGAKDYMLNGYADILFVYADSGDFSISFNPKTYDPKVIREQIDKIMSD